MNEIISIKLSEIDADLAFQPRDKLNVEAIEDYADLIIEHRKESLKYPFPPIIVYKLEGKKNYILCSGFHRFEANKKAESITIQAVVKNGTQKELLEESIKSNLANGVRYTQEDKRRCITLILQNPDFSDYTDHAISQLGDFSNHLVKKVRNELVSGDKHSIYKKVSRLQKIKNDESDDQISPEQKILSVPGILNTILSILKTDPTKFPPEIQESIRSFVESYSNLFKGE